jgi:hypothetical protein
MHPVLAVVLVISSVAVIFFSVAVMELIFQRRLIEILDRFLSRDMNAFAAQQFASGQREPLEQPLDMETELDLDALREASNALNTPINREPAEV